MKRKTDSLIFKFALIFLLFIIITILVSGYATYREQYNNYTAQCEDRVKNVSRYLAKLIEADGEEFLMFRDYVIAHKDELYLPVDFSTDYIEAKTKYDNLLATKYPGRTIGVDLSYDDLDDETLTALTIYNYIYWTGVFEKAREEFDVIYTYFLYPTNENLHMYWVIDGVRAPREDDPERLEFCYDAFEPLEKHEKMWEAWNTGMEPEGFDVYGDEYEFGNTYAFYVPLYIGNQKAGVLGAEVEIDKFNSDIFRNTLRQIAIIGLIIVVTTVCVLIFINARYIRKLQILQENVEGYATNKDPAVAGTIRTQIKGERNEITSLGDEVADMIESLDEHMQNLIKTYKELADTKEKAEALGQQAERDALTGIRNRHAYDAETQRIEWRMAQENFNKFGIAMIDLNFLKRINDTFGHDKGNVAIRKICEIVCHTFKHSPVFRIGGDEFVAILENDDYENAEQLIVQFDETLKGLADDETLEPWEKVSAAIGWTMFDPSIDSSVQNVFKRADELMYENKKAMKANRE